MFSFDLCLKCCFLPDLFFFFPPDFLSQHAMWGPLLAFSCFNGLVVLPQWKGVSTLRVIPEIWASR